jgi:hypothetical protein
MMHLQQHTPHAFIHPALPYLTTPGPHLTPPPHHHHHRHSPQIQDATFRSKRKGAPHVIARIRKSHTSKLATQYLNNLRTELAGTPERAGTVINNPEFVIPNDIVSALLTQVNMGSQGLPVHESEYCQQCWSPRQRPCR